MVHMPMIPFPSKIRSAADYRELEKQKLECPLVKVFESLRFIIGYLFRSFAFARQENWLNKYSKWPLIMEGQLKSGVCASMEEHPKDPKFENLKMVSK